MKPGDVFSVGVDLRVARGEKRAKYGVYDEVRATRGSHEIAFVSVDGRRLVKRIDVGEKAYVDVSFLEMLGNAYFGRRVGSRGSPDCPTRLRCAG